MWAVAIDGLYTAQPAPPGGITGGLMGGVELGYTGHLKVSSDGSQLVAAVRAAWSYIISANAAVGIARYVTGYYK